MWNNAITKKLLFSSFLFLTACSTISRFDQYSYTQATSIKVDALNIMNHATEQYTLHQDEVVRVNTEMDKIFEYEKNRPKNKITDKMWGVLKDTSGHLYGSFMKRWKREGKLDSVFIMEARTLVGESFDQISQLESGKIKSSRVTN